MILCNRLGTDQTKYQSNQVSKKNKNRKAYEKEILVNLTKVVVVLSRINLNFYQSTTGSLVHTEQRKE